ncbi:MAG: ABC transporter substrate-binding protein, partial [Fibrobacter sp.]|nr:ABC transporter substrate-binding protein [Fibrobacter sp.]
AGQGPVELIKSKDKELQGAIKAYNTLQSVENKNKIIALVNDIFDFQVMGQRALPKSVWDSASTAQRSSFVNQFERLVKNASITRLEMYQADSVMYTIKDSSAEKVTLNARLWYNDKQTEVVYKMQKGDGQWKVWDLLIGDMSTVRTYREQFTELLKTKTINELTSLIQKKADSYNESSDK